MTEGGEFHVLLDVYRIVCAICAIGGRVGRIGFFAATVVVGEEVGLECLVVLARLKGAACWVEGGSNWVVMVVKF